MDFIIRLLEQHLKVELILILKIFLKVNTKKLIHAVSLQSNIILIQKIRLCYQMITEKCCMGGLCQCMCVRMCGR